MKQPRIYYHKKSKRYYTDEIMKCSMCSNEHDLMIYAQFLSKREDAKYFICTNCFEKRFYKHSIIKQHVIVAYFPMIPEDSIPFVMKAPILKDSDLSVFEAASLPSDQTIDRTKHSKETWNGAVIGKEPDKKEIEQK